MISRWGYLPFTFENMFICLENLAPLNPDLVISGNLIADNVVRFINSLKIVKHSLPMLIMSGDSAVRDYIKNNQFLDVQVIKRNTPVNKIRSVITRVLDPSIQLKAEVSKPLIIGNSPEMFKLRGLISKLNQTKEVVLIEGEPGTGKELFARALHSDSEWRDTSFY